MLTCLACANLDNIIIKKDGTTTVQGGSPLNVLGSLGFTDFGTIDVSSDETFKNKGYSRKDIDSAKLDSMTLAITSPTSGVDFTFIDSIKFYASSPNHPRVLIAQGGPFQSGLTTVGLDVEDVDLADYATETSFTLESDVSGHDPSQTTTIKATAALNIDVNVTGVLCGK